MCKRTLGLERLLHSLGSLFIVYTHESDSDLLRATPAAHAVTVKTSTSNIYGSGRVGLLLHKYTVHSTHSLSFLFFLIRSLFFKV